MNKMNVFVIFLVTFLSFESSSAIPVPEDVAVVQLTSEMMEAATTSKPNYVLVEGTDCANRANIMTYFSHGVSAADCQTKCQMDESCTGFSIGSAGSGPECTILKGKCTLQQDPTHDLFLIQGTPTPTAEATPTETPTPTPTATATTTTTTSSAAQKNNSFFNLTIVIPTVRRFQNNGDPAPERYLSPLVQKLWQDLTPEQQKYVNFLILNSDKEPSKHIEALSLAVHPGVQVLSKPNWDEQLEQTLRNNGAIGENGEVHLEDGRQVSKEWIRWVAAEDMDGSYLLELGMKQSDYVLFLEDDVWPTTAALSKLDGFVKKMEGKPWLFLDLYTPNLNWAEGMLDVQDGGVYPFQCCTQSMLFKSESLPGIISYWRNHPAEPVDDNLRNYRKNVTPELQIYAARPNLFEHVGAYSSNPQKSTGIVEHTSLDFIPLML